MSRASRIRDFLSKAQERFERTLIGEIAISVVIAMILFTAVSWSSPDSAFRRAAVPVVEPVALRSGLDQAWYMFAPDPVRRVEAVEIHVDPSSGADRVWDFPKGNVFDQFSWYHWHKLKEQAVRTPDIRAPIARWAARQMLEPSDYPAEVSMVLTTTDFSPPGEHTDPAPSVTEVLYTETLTGPP